MEILVVSFAPDPSTLLLCNAPELCFHLTFEMNGTNKMLGLIFSNSFSMIFFFFFNIPLGYETHL